MDQRDPAWLLGERIKELTLLHEAAKLLDGTRAPDRALLSDLAALIPPAWVSPELCDARIRWGNLEARTADFRETHWMLHAGFSAGGLAGAVDVAYREATAEDPFLAEERALLRSLCEMLGASLGRYHAEHALREREARLTFLQTLTDAITSANDLDDILRIVVDRLGTHLHVSRVAVAHVEPDNASCTVPVCFTDDLPPLLSWELTPFGTETLLHATAPVVVRDVEKELPPEAAEKNLAAGVRAEIVCSSVRNGAIRSIVAVQQSTPRDWTEREVQLVSDTVSRAWAVIEQRDAEVRLRRNEELLRIAGETTGLGGWSIDLPDYRVAWSDEVCAIHELPKGQVPHRESFFDHYAPELRDGIRAAYAACMASGTPFDLEAQIVTSSGKRKWVRTTGRAERNASGEVVRVHGALQDIDEARRIENHLRQTQKMEAIGQLSAGIVHDFNNIVSVIQSYTALLIAERGEDAELCDDLLEIQRAGQRASELTRRLLTFSRQQVHQARLVDLKQLVDGMATMLRHAVGPLIRLRISATDPIPEAFVDPGQFEQVLLNLVVNARDAMPDGGVIAIELANATLTNARGPHGRFVMVAVRDTGQGMAESTRARIFEPFFTTKEPGKGTGLGLATVHGIVTQGGGHIEVESELGRGTTFKVYFPDGVGATPKKAVAPSVAPSPHPAAPSEGKRILLVDDEEALTTLSTRVLAKLGHRVHPFTDPAAALRAFREKPDAFDAVVTDVVMYPMNGFELVREIREVRPSVPVVITSGYFRQDDAVAAAALGLRSLILKTATVEELGRALDVELRHAR